MKGTTEVRDEVKTKARALEQALKERIDLRNYQDVLLIPWQPNPNYQLMYLLQHRVPIDDPHKSYVVIEPFISPHGWWIQTFYRVSSQSRNHLELQKLLDENGLRPEAEAIIHDKRFAYDEEDLDSIAAVVEEELSRISIIVREIGEKVH